MAGINMSSIILNDRWPGVPVPTLGVPTNGWDNTYDNYKTTATVNTPRYPLGTKVMAYSDNSWAPGWYTMMYLMYHSYCNAVIAGDISQDFSDGFQACTHCDGSTAQAYDVMADTSVIPYYVVSKCYTIAGGEVDYTRSQSSAGAVAVPCATLSSDGTGVYVAGYGDSYGWFWVGGVCPAKDVSIFDVANRTLGSGCCGIGACVSGDWAVRANGPLYFCISDAISTGLLTCDPTVAWKLANDISQDSQTIQPIGWSCMTAI